MPALNLILYVSSFFAIWLGSGLIINTVDIFSRRLKISPFLFSFFALGILTSIPEFAVGLTAISQSRPEIFVGNLLGGIIVLFLLAIPLLAILGREIKIGNHFDRTTLLAALLVIGSPALFILDRTASLLEGLVLILLYLLLFLIIERRHGLLDNKSRIMNIRSYSLTDVFKLILGISIVFVSSRFIVNQTLFFSQLLRIPPFIISITLLALGTNLPELSLTIRSILSHKASIALGDYIGSAAANAMLFGLLTLINQADVTPYSDFYTTFLFLLLGFGLFYYFSKSDKNISRAEGIVLVLFYIFFLLIELIRY